MIYPFKCSSSQCGLAFEVEEAYDKDKTYDSRPCPKCGEKGKRVYTMPAVHYKGLGFYSTDQEYAKQLKQAEYIAEHAHERQADNYMRKHAISKDDDFWNELAKREYWKDAPAKGKIISSSRPTTVLPEHEAKASTNIASSNSIVGETITPSGKKKKKM